MNDQIPPVAPLAYSAIVREKKQGLAIAALVFGILGLFYGPLILTMFLTLSEIYKSDYRDDLMAIHSPWVSSDQHEDAPEDAASAPEAQPATESGIESG